MLCPASHRTTAPRSFRSCSCLNNPNYGEPGVEGYHAKLTAAFRKLFEASGKTEPLRLKLDCANGVGAPQFRKTLELLKGCLEVRVAPAALWPWERQTGRGKQL